jgi:hypothetical protein
MMEELEHMSHPVVIEIKVLDDQSMTNGDSRSLKTAKIVAVEADVQGTIIHHLVQ